MIFYSKQTGGFYTPEVNGNSIPSDAVEITPERHRSLLSANATGRMISADKDGHPLDGPMPVTRFDQEGIPRRVPN